MSSAERFIDDLLGRCRHGGAFRGMRTGLSLLRAVWDNYRHGSKAARGLPVDGFKPELTAHNQRGQLLRHLRLHAGLVLLGWPGRLLSWAANLLDRQQARHGRLESQTEVRDNVAGRHCGRILRDFVGGTLGRDEARGRLQAVLLADP